MDENKATKVNSQLAAARAVIAASGKSPRELGNESRLKILMWIYRWGYTSSTLGQLLLNRTSGGYMQKLTKKDWLVSTKTISGVPPTFFTLSQVGLEEAERHSNTLYKYSEIDPYRVEQSKIKHYLIAQSFTINALKTGLISEFQTERMFGLGGDKLGVKRPDVVWVTPTGLRYGVEIELSAKWERQLDDFILKLIHALKAHDDNSSEFSRFIIVSDSRAIIERYKKAIQPGTDVLKWVRNDRRHWEVVKTYKVPEWLITKVDFQFIKS